jgi:HSP20 family molecular chaperone IbpA
METVRKQAAKVPRNGRHQGSAGGRCQVEIGLMYRSRLPVSAASCKRLPTSPYIFPLDFCRVPPAGPTQGRFVARTLNMTRMAGFSSPFLLGFDEIERALDRVSKAANDGYPPYNIERLERDDSEGDVIRITLAVAGFTRDQLDVSVEENQLLIRGRQVDDKSRQYLHRGIAARQFQRTFVLAEGIEILGADLKDGLLSIDLVRPQLERVVRKIEINAID